MSLISSAASAKAATKISEFREDDHVDRLEFTPDSKQIMVGVGTTLKPHIDRWEFQSHPHIVQTIPMPFVGADFMASDGLHYSPDGKLLAVTHGFADDVAGGEILQIFDSATDRQIHSVKEPMGGGAYTRFAFTPDGQFMVRTFDARRPPGRDQFMVHRTDTFAIVWGMPLVPFDPNSLAVSPDGKWAAVGGRTLGPGIPKKTHIVIIDLAARKISRTIDDVFQGSSVHALTWSPDGKNLAAGGVVGSDTDHSAAVRIFDSASGSLVRNGLVGISNIWTLRYTPDGKHFLEVDTKGVRLWDGRHDHLLQEFPGKFCEPAAVSRDGRLFAISDDDTVTIWQFL